MGYYPFVRVKQKQGCQELSNNSMNAIIITVLLYTKFLESKLLCGLLRTNDFLQISLSIFGCGREGHGEEQCRVTRSFTSSNDTAALTRQRPDQHQRVTQSELRTTETKRTAKARTDHNPLKREDVGGTWGVQSGKPLTLDFHSDSDLTIMRLSLAGNASWAWSLRKSLSLPRPVSLPLLGTGACSLSLDVLINRKKKKRKGGGYLGGSVG